jgi:hypothetical protein
MARPKLYTAEELKIREAKRQHEAWIKRKAILKAYREGRLMEVPNEHSN